MPPSDAVERLGVAMPKLQRYAELLATEGVVRGLIGPREVPRLWDRHLLNSAALLPLLPDHGHVVDVGAGAGLPGIVIGIARPDLAVTLLEPLLRRVRFLSECVEELDLPNVRVLRGRAEEHGGFGADVVVARAVAPLARLATVCLPLLRPGGELLAIKGATADEELRRARTTLDGLGAVARDVLTVSPPQAVARATVVRIVAATVPERGESTNTAARAAGRRRKFRATRAADDGGRQRRGSGL
jgi:16S rRNA (guanine527-N7)-methyltransferase